MGRLLPLAAAALIVAAPAAWAGGGARNLVATPSVKAALRTSFLRAHPRLPPAKVKGPLRGLTYYGSYSGVEYALATFSIPRFGTQDQPELFRRAPGGNWHDRGDTGGDVCPAWIPAPLLRLWDWQREPDGCYTPP
jgi:hypothetical protein